MEILMVSAIYLWGVFIGFIIGLNVGVNNN